MEIISDGENKITKNVSLTGSAIDVKEISGLALIAKYPLAWFFIIFVLGFVVFMIFRKGYKKSFFGYIPRWKKNKEEKTISKEPSKKGSIVDIKNKAELSLSLKGEKQSASIISLEIKNLDEITGKEESIRETLQKITDLAEENNAAVYENHANFFLILAPIITKTFKNERKAVEIAGKIKEILTKHNKLFKQKMDFGISLNYGDIIANKEKNVLKFMSFGNFITAAKKASSISDKEIYLTEAIKNRLIADVKTEKKDINGVEVYTIKQIKREKEEHKKFISDFIKRLEGKKEE